MNRNKLKTYAPQARRDFIQAVTDRATQYGLTAKTIEPMTEQGEVVLIGGRPFPKAVGVKRKKLEARIHKLGFEQTMEAMAYTWFNRLVAIRFMELHGYLEHGFRVVSHPEGHTQPEILEHAQHVDLPGLDQKKVVELKLDGTKEEELYRLLLIAQCNALHKALPFLFESINDEAEILLPDHLLHSDSLIRNLVNEIEEDDWKEVEIIGWLYQFYISEKKDEVIGKVVASEDIPAATQLFTPNWIVKYLVQNTLGRQWLATYPNSPLKGQMEYYIEPAEQTPEVQEQLRAITPASLNPEELTLLDPACGSGHILVEAYDLFKAIYQERGYRAKDIPGLILQKNLFGLEIDDRAAQLAAFALMMKARSDDRRIFESDAKPNILAFEDSQGMSAADITHALNSSIASLGEGHVSQGHIAAILELFENAKIFGSLTQIPTKVAAHLPEIDKRLNDVLKHGDLTHVTAKAIKPLLQQAQLLAKQYDVVVANPPYMGGKAMNKTLKSFAANHFPDSKSDTFAMFVDRCFSQLANGYSGFVTPYVWMFISSYEALRTKLTTFCTLTSLVQLEYNAFEPACVPVCTFTFRKLPLRSFVGDYIKLSQFRGHASQAIRTVEAIRNPDCGWRYQASTEDFSMFPGTPIAYWASKAMRELFHHQKPISDFADLKVGLQTGENERFLRLWYEVSFLNVGFMLASRDEARASGLRWFPYSKGGEYRKWYGNNEFVVNWHDDGSEIRSITPKSVIRNPGYLFRPSITWSALSSGGISLRKNEAGFLFDTKGQCLFASKESDLFVYMGFLNSCVAREMLSLISPTLDFNAGNVSKLPFLHALMGTELGSLSEAATEIARDDWNDNETSWNFERPRTLIDGSSPGCVKVAVEQVLKERCDKRKKLQAIETKVNEIVIDAYNLGGEFVKEVNSEQVTLPITSSTEVIQQLVSYAIGCMMGRFSLDKLGLIYAHSGNKDFDPSQYNRFPADEDGILPITEFNWFPDDAASRFEKFVATAFPAEHLEDNLKFVAESLGAKKGEMPQNTIRRYLACDYFKSHLQLYKGPKHPPRPIYWLFSSGKHRGYQALVYLHRYNEGTLARMRTEYVIPLLGKMTARIDQLTDDISAASSSQHRKRLETEKSTIIKQLAEVQAFDEKLRHCADRRIKLDLDDGVKVNYGKFGDLLAEVKSVTGGNSDE